MLIDLGSLAFDSRRKTQSWVVDIQRYRWMRFFGYSSKRLFFGFIVTSHDGPNPDTYPEDRVKFYENQLQWAKQDLESVIARRARDAREAEGK